MAKSKPRTKTGKAAKFGKVMGEFKRGTLRSSSGRKVAKRSQAKAIAASEAGLPKKRGVRKGRKKGS